jgi:hypothetical protein
MKSLTKVLLVGAVAVMAMAVSVAPSEAKKHKKMAAPAPCSPAGVLCTTPTTNVMVCGLDGKWYQALFTPVCVGPVCPAKCS